MGVIAIIFSCNSNEKNTGSPDTKDSTVVTKKEVQSGRWTTNSDLILGTIQATLKVDGASLNVDSAEITIRPKSDFSAIDLSCSRATLRLRCNWHGMGDHDKASAEWTDITEGAPTLFSSDYDAPGTMKITEWSDGKIAGSFSVTVIENNALFKPRKKLLEGEFHYISDK